MLRSSAIELERPQPATGLRPGLAVTFGGDGFASLERLLPLADFVEISPDTLAVLGERGPYIPERTLAQLASIAVGTPLIIHGVGLSIGTHSGCCESYLRLLDQLFDRLPIAWHGEHLAYTMVDGEHLGTMLPLPRNDAVLEMVARRVERILQRYGAPFLLEHVVHLLPDPGGERTHAQFLNALSRESGCGLILDVYNLECDRINGVLDAGRFLSEIDTSRVVEMHLAGGVEHRGLQLDVHSRLVPQAALDCCATVLAGGMPALRAVTYEYLPEAEAALGIESIAGELQHLRARLL